MPKIEARGEEFMMGADRSVGLRDTRGDDGENHHHVKASAIHDSDEMKL